MPIIQSVLSIDVFTNSMMQLGLEGLEDVVNSTRQWMIMWSFGFCWISS